jgi:hypothetical protein
MRLAIYAALALVFSCDAGKKAVEAGVDSGGSDRGEGDRANDTGTTGISGMDVGPPQLVVSPASIFLQATTPVGALDSASFVIENPGGAPTGPLLLSMSVPDTTNLTLYPENCLAGLPPGGRCTAFLLFEPIDMDPDPALGAEIDATITISDSALSGLVATVEATAVALVPSEGLAILGPPDMGSIRPGSISGSLPFMVINTGSSNSGTLQLSISSPQFVKTVDQCSGNSLASADTCSFEIQFVPANLGFQWAILTAQGSAGSMVASEILSGSGQ